MSTGIIYFGEDQDAFKEAVNTIETDSKYRACVTSRTDTAAFISVVFSSRLDDFIMQVLFVLESKKIGPKDYIWTHSDTERDAFISGFRIGFKLAIKK